ncbi:MAG TPA: carbon storage regulator CsrA [Tissierellaceae bacterium]
MLVLNRKIGESIVIDSDTEITILDIKDGRVKIGIEAPKDKTILRKEVYEEVERENKDSVDSSNPLDILGIKINKNI